MSDKLVVKVSDKVDVTETASIKAINNGSQIVICQQWEESEAGWGTRLDGYTLHLSMEDCIKFAKTRLENQQAYFKERGIHGVPDEYTRTDGKPFPVRVGPETFKKIKEKADQFGMYGEGHSQSKSGNSAPKDDVLP